MAPRPARLYWIDHLRTLVILLVVNLHCCVTYSHIGGWYINSTAVPGRLSQLFFGLWEGHLQSFFMGIMFFFAGYFSWGSLLRKGPGMYARDRLVRLGIPVLVFMLVIQPFIVKGINPWNADFPPFWQYYSHWVLSGDFLGGTGPMWFAFALLLFSLIWARLRAMIAPLDPRTERVKPAPSGRNLVLFALILGFLSFLVRLVQPIGTNIMNMQLCFFVQYIAAFAVGLAAARHQWLAPLAASKQAIVGGWMAAIGGPIVFIILILTGVNRSLEVLAGGWHWQAAGYAFWEQATGVGLSLGLMALFSRVMNRDGVFLRWLSDRSFAVYFIHTPILIGLFLILLSVHWPAWPMALLMTVIALPLAFVAADLVRRIPGFGKIL